MPPHHRLHRPSRVPHPRRQTAPDSNLENASAAFSSSLPYRSTTAVHAFQPIHVHVLHIHHLRTRFPVRASPSAQPAPAVRRLRNQTRSLHRSPSPSPPSAASHPSRGSASRPHASRQRKLRLICPCHRLRLKNGSAQDDTHLFRGDAGSGSSCGSLRRLHRSETCVEW